MGKKKQTPRHTKVIMLFITLGVILGAVCLANFFTGVTGAVTADTLNDEVLTAYTTVFNEKAKGMPDIVLVFLGEEVVNIYLSDVDVSLYALLKDDQLIELERGTQEDPTITITTTYDTVVKLQQKDFTLDYALDNGLVSFSSPSFVKKVELAVVLYSIDIYDMFT